LSLRVTDSLMDLPIRLRLISRSSKVTVHSVAKRIPAFGIDPGCDFVIYDYCPRGTPQAKARSGGFNVPPA
jgi:hypothetical protein